MRRSAEAGFSIAEITVILMALAVFSGVAAPAIDGYVERAQLVRARHDVRTIAVSLTRLIADVGAEGRTGQGWATYDLLVGTGAVPGASNEAAAGWIASEAVVGRLDDHLVANRAAYRPYDRDGGFGWRGAYLQERISADPWGQRYAVNIASMRGGNLDTVVISAGPDARVETAFESDGLPLYGDDLLAVVATAGGSW